jgi:hypothetical protein
MSNQREQVKFQSRSFPLALLFLLLVTFGVLFPRLGLYWDDWPAVVAARLKGVQSFWEFYQGERPFSAWTYILTMPVLGTSPITWHIVTLLLRWLGVLSVWWVLRLLWPTRVREATWIAIIFSLYPVFTNQSVAVAFSQHWITFLLFFLSLGLMLLALRQPRHFWQLTALALFAEILHVLTMEYFWGFELIRPIMLWFVLSEDNLAARQKIKKTFLNWLPYLLTLAVGFALRMTVFVDLAKDPNRPDLLYNLTSQPIATTLRLLQLAVQDFVFNLLGGWFQTILPAEVNLSSGLYLFSLLVAIVVGALVFYYLSHLSLDEPHLETDHSTWVKQAMLLGFAATMLAPVPVWLSDRQVLWGLYGGRFGFAAEFGLSILLFALLEWLTVKPLPKLILVSSLVGLAAGFHIRTAYLYTLSTKKQNQFYWQLYWRAPYIKPGTAILSSDELFTYVGRNSTALALNLLYPQPAGAEHEAYWFLEMDYDFSPKTIPLLPQGKVLNRSFRNFSFVGDSRDSLVIDYSTSKSHCLWMLTPDDAENLALPDLTRLAVPVSDLSRIIPQPLSAQYPAQDAFGKEPEHTWCYYYQKADLARQFGDWTEVAQLGDEAEIAGYQPADANEWLPFIQGYARSDQWEKAFNRTRTALTTDEQISPRLCKLWLQIQQEVEVPASTLSRLGDLLKCSLP